MSRKLLILFLLFIIIQGLFAQNLLNNNDKNNIMLSFGAGLGKYEMSNINDIYLDQYAKPLGAFTDNINSGLLVNLCVKHVTSNNIKLGIGINYFQAIIEKGSQVEDWVAVPAREYYLETTLKITAIVPDVFIEYSITKQKNSTLDLGLSGLYGFGKSLLKSESEEIDLHDKFELSSNGLGYKIYIAFSVKLNNNFGIGVETGYKNLTTSDLEDNDGDKWFIEPVNIDKPMNLDFTGIYIKGNIFIFI